jgi:hypothetical protein
MKNALTAAGIIDVIFTYGGGAFLLWLLWWVTR